MNRTMIVAAIAGAIAGAAYGGQWATEQFIPIGESPGISGEYSCIGTVASIDVAARTLTVSTDDGAVVAGVTEDTVVWVDRSDSGGTNTVGSIDDLTVGAVVEVLSEEHERKGAGPAEWIKVKKPE